MSGHPGLAGFPAFGRRPGAVGRCLSGFLLLGLLVGGCSSGGRSLSSGGEPLPGGDLGPGGFDGLLADLARDHAYLPAPAASRIAHAYGRRAANMLGDAKRIEDLGERLVGDLYRRELDYLRAQEWAKTADDVLWRRTKLGIAASESEVEAVKAALGA